jgi:signal transduction histidine kinase
MNELLSRDLGVIIVALAVFFLLLFLVLLTIAVRYRKRRRENEELKAQFSQVLMQSQLEIQEQTLQHISREIHDNLGQVASLIKINLNTLRIDASEAESNKLENTRELVRNLITDLKLLSTTLNSDKVLKGGLIKSLEFEAGRLQKTGVFMSACVVHDVIPPIDSSKAIILYRMSQEIINNAMKHSNAKHINIDVYYSGNILSIVIRDDGNGFNPAEKMQDANETGNGLGNLVNRARLIDATIHFNSTPREGTIVTINMNN